MHLLDEGRSFREQQTQIKPRLTLFFSLPTISTVPTDNYDLASEKHGPVMQHKRIEAQIPLD